ncbi:membrane protein insertase YidC [Lentisphaerota bacterium WC36G]|nr:membrane protein insertase YidC [Lentisphaerae bacterium WC36]
MKLDKETIVVLLVAALLALSINPILQKLGLIQSAPVSATTETTTTENPASKTVAAKPSNSSTTTTKAQSTAVNSEQNVEYKAFYIENNSTKLTVGNNGAVEAVELLNFKKTNSEENVTINTALNTNQASNAFNVQLPQEWVSTKIVKSEVSADKKSFILTRLFSNNLSQKQKLLVTQEWSLEENYQLKYNISFKNDSKEAIIIPEVAVLNIALLPTKQIFGDEARSEHIGADYLNTNDSVVTLRSEDDEDEFLNNKKTPAKWISITNKYFVSVIRSKDTFTDGIETMRAKYNDEHSPKKDAYIYKVTIAGKLGTLKLNKMNDVKLYSFDCFIGPKSLANLTKFDQSTKPVMHLIGGWSIFNSIATFMLLALEYLKTLFANSYGWAIIALTLIVRALFWPLTQKANKSMKKMQELQPKILAIREKYKDPQLQSAKTMELYRQEKVNPVGGCLPLFLQLPVFIALYWALDGMVDLRQASFGWAANLAQPDTVATIGSLPINPLVIMWAILMLLQQKLTPTAMEKNQQIVMYIMPAVMLVMLYNLPSGLTLYWTVSQVFSIVQMLINNRSGKKEEQSTAKAS